MVKVLVLIAVVAVLAALWFRLKRSRGAAAHSVDGRKANASKLAAEQAVISRQGGQGGGQGGVGGGMGF